MLYRVLLRLTSGADLGEGESKIEKDCKHYYGKKKGQQSGQVTHYT